VPIQIIGPRETPPVDTACEGRDYIRRDPRRLGPQRQVIIESMRSRFARAMSIGVLVLAAGCGGPSPREYPLEGQILGVDAARQELLIKHKDIQGFMPGMTMPFPVRDKRLLEGRAAGDLIRATLVVEDAKAYLAAIEKTGTAPVDTPPPAPTASSGFELLRPGEEVPDQAFVDQAGRERRLSEFQGRSVAVTFIYTRCPIPTFCPYLDRQFAEVQRTIKQRKIGSRVHLLSVSFDPEYDTPTVLAAHAAKLAADPAVWTFATGNRDDIDRFARRLGLTLVRDTNPADIAHNLRTAVIDPRRRVVKVFTGVEWTPEELMTELERAISAQSD
jgi:protein SCO1/2